MVIEVIKVVNISVEKVHGLMLSVEVFDILEKEDESNKVIILFRFENELNIDLIRIIIILKEENVFIKEVIDILNKNLRVSVLFNIYLFNIKNVNLNVREINIFH